VAAPAVLFCFSTAQGLHQPVRRSPSRCWHRVLPSLVPAPTRHSRPPTESEDDLNEDCTYYRPTGAPMTVTTTSPVYDANHVHRKLERS
jgi:hypothetical protein